MNCFLAVVLEKILESLLNCQEIKPVNSKGNQSWIFIGRTDNEALILWPPDAKNWLIGKDLDAGKDWRQEKKGTEDEVVGWHHWLDGHEFEQALAVGDGQGSLACCSPWDHKESDIVEWWWMELNPRAKTQLHTTVHRHKPLPPEACTSHYTSLIHQGQTPEARNDPMTCRTDSTNTGQKLLWDLLVPVPWVTREEYTAKTHRTSPTKCRFSKAEKCN